MKKIFFTFFTFFSFFIFLCLFFYFYGKDNHLFQETKAETPWIYPEAKEHVFTMSNSDIKIPVGSTLIREYSFNSTKANHLFLAGGSNTFGQGIKDQHLKKILSPVFPNYNIQYMAYPGWGPSHVLKRLESLNLKDIVPQENGIFLYQFFGYHLVRCCPNLTYLGWSKGGTPHYEIRGDDLEYLGAYFESPKYHWQMISIGIYKFFVDVMDLSFDENYELTLGDDKCMKLTAKILKRMKDTYLASYPSGKFRVVIMPGFWHESNREFMKYLKLESIDMTDGHLFFEKGHQDLLDEGGYLQKDNHFTSKLLRELTPMYKHIINQAK